MYILLLYMYIAHILMCIYYIKYTQFLIYIYIYIYIYINIGKIISNYLLLSELHANAHDYLMTELRYEDMRIE